MKKNEKEANVGSSFEKKSLLKASTLRAFTVNKSPKDGFICLSRIYR